jgi:hypothetical protein
MFAASISLYHLIKGFSLITLAYTNTLLMPSDLAIFDVSREYS